MKNKKILLFTPTFKFKNLHRYKDVWIIIENFKRDFNYETYILTTVNEIEYKNYKSNVILIKNEFLGFLKNIFLIKPDLLIMFHPTLKTLFYSIIFKFLNFKWKVYIKSDTDLKNLKYYKDSKLTYIYILFVKIFSIFAIISFENKKDFELLKNKYKLNIIHIPNWIDCIKNNFENNYKKENIIITVWRLGTYQKNTQELLEILKVLLNNDNSLKAVLIWEIQDETNFKDFLNKFLLENQNIKDRIIFTWNITQDKVFEYYKKSKFFILTSRYEWFSCSLPEAAFFGNIIISRNVWWVWDITNNWKYWFIYNNISEIDKINNFIKNDYIKINKQEYLEYINNNYTYKNILNNLNNKIFKWKY